MDVLRLQREYFPGEWPKPGNFAYLDVPATASCDEVLTAFLMKATQAHPDVQANEKKKQKLAESLEWTEAFHPRIVYDKGGRMVPPTQPTNGGYNPDLVPLSDIFTRHLDAWNGRKPVVRAKDWEHLCRQYAERVGPTPYNTGVNVCGLGDAHTVFDHAAEICRLKLVQKARNDAMAQPWARPSNELPPVKWGERHPDVTCDPDNWKTDEFKAWERAKAEEKAAAAEAKKWAALNGADAMEVESGEEGEGEGEGEGEAEREAEAEAEAEADGEDEPERVPDEDDNDEYDAMAGI